MAPLAAPHSERLDVGSKVICECSDGAHIKLENSITADVFTAHT